MCLYQGEKTMRNNLITNKGMFVNTVTKALFALSILVLITATSCVSMSGGRKDLTLLTEDYWKNATVQSVQDKIAEGVNVNIADENGITALLYALVFSESSDLAEVLINAGADVNQKNNWGGAVLGNYLQNKGVTVEKISLLIEFGADINHVDDDGYTPLINAAEKQDPEIIQFLLDAGADVSRATNNGWTPLLLAARYNENPEVLQILLDAGADPNYTKEDGFNVLMASMLNYEVGGVRDKDEDEPDVIRTRILLNAGADVNAKTGAGTTALMWAARANKKILTLGRTTISSISGDDPTVIQMLIDAGADVNAQNDLGNTALNWAAQFNNSDEVVSILVNAGANVNKADNGGWLPLKVAARYNENEEITRILLDAGSEIPQECLYLAAGYNLNYKIGALLIDAGADVNYRFGENGRTPLMAVVELNFDTSNNLKNEEDKNLEWVKLLLNAGADVNAVSNDGYTPLLLAMNFNIKEVEGDDGEIRSLIGYNNDAEVARLLLEAGADVNAEILPETIKVEGGGVLRKYSRTVEERTPIIIAAEQNTVDLMKVLLEYGADVNHMDHNGATALMLACIAWQNGRMSPEKIDFLLEAGADPSIRTTGVVSVFAGTNNDGEKVYANFEKGVKALAFLEANTVMKESAPADYSRYLELLK